MARVEGINVYVLLLFVMTFVTLGQDVGSEIPGAFTKVSELLTTLSVELLNEANLLLPSESNLCTWKEGDDFNSYLLTPGNKNPNPSNEIPKDKLQLKQFFINVNPTCVYVVFNGFNENKDNYALRPNVDQILNQNCAVILIDWEAASSIGCYESFDLKINANIGQYITCYVEQVELVHWVSQKSALIFKIHKETGLDPSKFSVLGQSLGAHVAGTTGRILFQLHGIKFRIIYGLDPAGPGFAGPVETTCFVFHLRAGDAQCVIIFHSNAAVFGTTHFTLGNKDIIINGGSVQSQCGIWLKPGQADAVQFILCNHLFARRVWSMVFLGAVDGTDYNVYHTLDLLHSYPVRLTLFCDKYSGTYDFETPKNVPCYSGGPPDCEEAGGGSI